MTSANADTPDPRRHAERLLHWMEQRHWSSFDVCDMTAMPWRYRLEQLRRRFTPVRFLMAPYRRWVEQRHPAWVRRAFRIQPRAFPQAFANIARGCCCPIWREDMEKQHLAVEILEDVLPRMRAADWKAPCWGQPYDWLSQVLIPADTPRTTVTSIVIHALLDGWETTQKPAMLDLAHRASTYFLEYAQRPLDTGEQLCISYTPLDQMAVHNANMVAAAACARLWKHTGDQRLRDFWRRATRYTTSDQREDGAWHYFGPPAPGGVIDSYHTGYVIESLLDIREVAGADWMDAFESALRRGLQFYLTRFVGPEGEPVATTDDPFPFDIQSASQLIITICRARECGLTPDVDAATVLRWTNAHLYDDDQGYYYYRMYNDGRVDRTPYIRWAESWMFRALSMMASLPRST